MARKRKQSGIDLLVRSPWWISAVLGIVGFIVLRWLIPSFFASNPFLVSLAAMSRSLAWLAPCGFGVIALISFFANKRVEDQTFTPKKQKSNKVTRAEPSLNINGQEKWGNARPHSSPSIPDVIIPPYTPTWSIGSLRSLEWKRFELLCAKYYEAAGFKAVTIAAGADGGIDIKLFKTNPDPIAIVQCKAWSKAVGVKEVRELLGVMAHEKVARGIFITNGTYTPDALAFGTSNPIQLLDGNAFLQKIQDLDLSAQDKLAAFAFDGDYKTPKLLVASHIVPWRTNANHRLNPRNGLCLSVLHDKAFDLGMFTLTSDFKIKTSRHIQAMSNNLFANECLVKLDGKQIELPEKFRPELEFLDWHHQNIFMSK